METLSHMHLVLYLAEEKNVAKAESKYLNETHLTVNKEAVEMESLLTQIL